MHGMDSLSIESGTDLISPQNMAESPVEPAADSSHAMSNCEQACGYCLGFSQPGAKISNLFYDVGSSLQADIYSRFAPSDPLKSLFRPPIFV